MGQEDLLKKIKKLLSIFPALVPLGQGFLKQFPNPGPEGPVLSWKFLQEGRMVIGGIEPYIRITTKVLIT